MPIALTVFGAATDTLDPTLSYVLLRTVRGPGEYPAPTLPKDIAVDGVRSATVPDSPLTIITWDGVFPQTDERAVLTELQQGRLTLPSESPIAGGETVTGVPFGPLIVEEERRRVRVTGSGLLYRRGVASDAPSKALREALDKCLKPGTMPMALRALVGRIGELSGIDEIFKRRRPLGIVDYFYRDNLTMGMDGPLFDVAPEKPDFRTQSPMLQVHVRRHAAPINQKFRLQIALGNYDKILCSILRDIEPDVAEVTVTAPGHITDVSLSVFDNTGHLVDQLKVSFVQGMQFLVTAQGSVDILPPPLPGSQKTADLEARPRIHTVAFEGPSIPDRSGGLDVLRKQEAKLAQVIGAHSNQLENIWFDRGVKSQIEVIRWIKKKIERPGIRKAYLIDPYLGSEALKRIVARQGNETAEMFIVVSPGDIDPDADTVEKPAVSDYLAKLVSTAAEWASKLAGRISIVHVKRAGGSRQAFHDRYLCLVDQNGIPTTYLLSNSLSKAAGDWPFAICELVRVVSWRVYVHIQELILGQSTDGERQSEVIWKSPDAAVAPEPPASAEPSSADTQATWVAAATAFLSDIRNVIIRNSEFKSEVGARVDAFLRTWPQGVDIDKLGEALFKVVSHRDAIVVFVSDRLRDAGRSEIANILDDNLLARFLEFLPKLGHKGGWFFPFDARRVVLEHLGGTIVRKENATNFVRGKFNPKIYELVTMIETQRVDPTHAWDMHEASVFLSVIALHVAIDAVSISERFRIGVANDYIYWLGRLMRSDVAGIHLAQGSLLPEWLDDLTFAAHQIADARRVLGETLDVAIGRLNDDPWVAPVFKRAIAESVGNPGASPRSRR